jgi:hypothetical protein
MPNNPNAEDNLTPFPPGKSGNPKGRPKSSARLIVDALKAKGYETASPQDVKEIYLAFMNLPETELLKIVADKKSPMVARIAAKAILGKEGFKAIETMLSRTSGDPMAATLNVTVSPIYSDAVPLPDDV